MVVHKNWNNADASQQNPVTESSSGGTWGFQAPSKTLSVRSNTPFNMQAKQPVTRQIAINTLAAMHRRFSLPGPVQPHSRPIAEFRASANKSLDMLRQTIQSAVTREIDQVIKKYLEKFFVPAVNNIRLNLGDESVSEDQERNKNNAKKEAFKLSIVSICLLIGYVLLGYYYRLSHEIQYAWRYLAGLKLAVCQYLVAQNTIYNLSNPYKERKIFDYNESIQQPTT